MNMNFGGQMNFNGQNNFGGQSRNFGQQQAPTFGQQQTPTFDGQEPPTFDGGMWGNREFAGEEIFMGEENFSVNRPNDLTEVLDTRV